jgi:hypothetical protein
MAGYFDSHALIVKLGRARPDHALMSCLSQKGPQHRCWDEMVPGKVQETRLSCKPEYS